MTNFSDFIANVLTEFMCIPTLFGFFFKEGQEGKKYDWWNVRILPCLYTSYIRPSYITGIDVFYWGELNKLPSDSINEISKKYKGELESE